MQKASKLFWPMLITPKNAARENVDALSRSQRLMTELGLVKSANNGTFQIMPLAQRALDKCISLVNQRMQSIGGQKITLPILTSSSLWKKSGRLNGDITEFFMLRDRHGKEFLLSPTHEESVTAMLASIAPLSYRQLPLRLYQIGQKFRDELKPRFGLMRAKEFVMKDMYSFDSSELGARMTYDELNAAYADIFRQLEVPFVKVEANGGMMGGSVSHEFQYVADTGEDLLLRCSDCGYASTAEVKNAHIDTCSQCKSIAIEKMRGIEIGHTFLLSDKYSRALGATFLQENGKPTPFIMGCYGIGISRLIAAALEVLSSNDELRWPALLTPYDVCIIGPKQGSKEQQIGDIIEKNLCRSVAEICGEDELLHDDRKYLTIGKRLFDSKRMGYPLILVVGSKIMQEIPKIELHIGETKMDMELNEVLSEIKKYRSQKVKLLSCQWNDYVEPLVKSHNNLS